MSLVLERFYEQLRTVAVSALTGQGMDDFMRAAADARREYETEYLPDLLQRKKVGGWEPLEGPELAWREPCVRA